MAGTGRLPGEEEFAVRGRKEQLVVNVTVFIHTRAKERKRA